ncbi:MAG: dihydropteroate synthase [Candidatus Omnitrophota bacterium]
MKVIPLKIKSKKQAKDILSSLGVDSGGIEILASKSINAAFKIEGISSWEANIIKQHALSLGTDAAINRDALIKKIKTDVLVFGNVAQLKKLCDKLRNQPFKLKLISSVISQYLDAAYKERFVFKARDKVLKIENPVICGIINLTPDSFSGDGLLVMSQVTSSKAQVKKKVKDLALRKAEEMIKNGAEILDLGGESSRPFAKAVKAEDEISRVIPVLSAIRKEFKKVIISLDTYKYKVACAGVGAGADIINDISAFRNDSLMGELVKKHKLGCVLMHMKGRPATMQIKPKYKDVSSDIVSFFKERLEFTDSINIDRDRIFLDPGIGFGKRVEDNFKIINDLYKFKIFGLPIFLGISRKSFIGKTLNVDVKDCDVGTIAAHIVSVVSGVNVLRVHDVSKTKQAVKIACQIMNS